METKNSPLTYDSGTDTGSSLSENSASGSGNMAGPEGKKPPVIRFFINIWTIIKRSWLAIKEWYRNSNMTRTDKWAVVICLLCSFAIWLYVMNTDDTGYQNTISYITVEIEGDTDIKNNGMSITSGYGNVVTITLKGKRSDIGGLSAADITAYVDASDINKTGRYPLPVLINLPDNAELVSVEPSSISVNIDKNTQVTREIRVKLNYSINAKYTVGDYVLNYDTVTITGPQSALDEIAYAAAVFNQGEINTSLTLSGSIALYNKFDQVIDNPDLKLSVTDIIVKVPVTMRKTVPVKLTFTNGISPNYDITITPAEITLVGDPQILDTINDFSVYTINNDLIVVGEPFKMLISSISLPDGVIWENSEQGISITVERLY
jgi:YbbR domain-containing protein